MKDIGVMSHNASLEVYPDGDVDLRNDMVIAPSSPMPSQTRYNSTNDHHGSQMHSISLDSFFLLGETDYTKEDKENDYANEERDDVVEQYEETLKNSEGMSSIANLAKGKIASLKGGQDEYVLFVKTDQSPHVVNGTTSNNYNDGHCGFNMEGSVCGDFDLDEQTALLRNGLRNLGNTCFLNSVLQMLFSLENGFVDDLLHPCGVFSGSQIVPSGSTVSSPTSVFNAPHETYEIKRVNSMMPLHTEIVCCEATSKGTSNDEVQTTADMTNPDSTLICCDPYVFDFDIIKICWPGYDSDLSDEDGVAQVKKLHDALVYIGQKLLDSDTELCEVDPTPIKRIIDLKTNQFSGYQQHDSHEFMTKLLDILSEEQEQDNLAGPIEAEPNEYSTHAVVPLDRRKPSFTHTNVVDLHFCSEVLVTLTCTKCQAQKSKRETYRHISLTLDSIDSYSVEMAFKKYFSPEEREVKCEHCGSETAIETMKFTRLPNALLLHLKRFIIDLTPNLMSSYRKNNAKVQFSEELDLSSYCAPHCVSCTSDGEESPVIIHQCPEIDTDFLCSGFKAQFEPVADIRKKYKLKSTIHHIGTNTSRGHYSADVKTQKNGQDLWMRCSDSVVTPCPDTENTIFGESSQKRVYMLMYELDM